MHPLKTATAGLLLAAAPFFAHADDMSYRYFQVGYLETNVDGTSASADGFGTRGSIGFAENFFVFTEINQQEIQNFDLNQYAVGIGGHFPISDNVDLVGRVGWARAEIDAGGGNDVDGDGYIAGAGIRGRAGEHIELEAGVVHVDYGSGADDTGAELAARYHFDKRWALALEYTDTGDLSTFMAGVRINFGVGK
jgi:hypothetical protein